MSDTNRSVQSAATFFGSVAMGKVVEVVSGSRGLGFAFGGVGIFLAGVVLVFDPGDDVGVVLGLGMCLIGAFCCIYGVVHV